MITRAFLDVDGVICDFTSSALMVMGITREQMEERVPIGTWNVNHGTMEESEFWKRVDSVPSFWESMSKLPDADKIVGLCESYFGENVVLLTTPPSSPDSYSGKARWVKANFPKLYRRMFIGPNKYLLAHFWAVLVDDSEKNCSKFEDAGGHAVLVPDRGNRLYTETHRRVEHVKESFDHLMRKRVG